MADPRTSKEITAAIIMYCLLVFVAPAFWAYEWIRGRLKK